MSSPADPRPTLAAPDDDPWLWLEEVEGERALAWVAGQNAATLARLADARYEADRDAVKAALDRPDKLPFVTRVGGLLYNFWQDAGHPRGLWRRTTLESYQTEAPDWEVLLDLDALAQAEGEDWVFQGGMPRPGRNDRAILHLSRGGGDACVLREYDLVARRFAPDGFALPEAKGGALWLDDDTLLLSSAWGEGMATTSGYARTVRRWPRGTDPAAAPVLFACDPGHMGVGVQVDRETPGRVLYFDRIAFYEAAVHVGDRDGPRQRVPLPLDAEYTWQRDWVAVRPRSPWTVGGVTYAPDTLLGARLEEVLAGEARYEVLFTPAERRALQSFFWCSGRLVVSVLDELQPVFHVLMPGEAGWTAAELPGLPRTGVASVWPLDARREESDGSLLAQAQDPITPVRLMLTDVALTAPALLKQSSPTFDATGLVVTRHEAVSIDGTRIPYTQTGPAAESSGEAPVYMTGYGGFRVPSLPYYQAVQGKLWLERGGTTVVANLRGGGEFGTPWHEAGRRASKRLSHDDFAAVAADLVRRGVTRPGRIAAEGGSNGGLLIANMLTRYPERFGALFCTIPLIDMRRYSRLLAGASWIAEYGDPEKPDDWDFLQHLSAYHVAEPGRRYPPILLATTRRDDRVHPGHARKMAAKLQALGYPALFYEPPAGGHGYGKDNAEVASFAALGSAFLRRAIGWETEVA
ncbi:prolyl oligopeptidase family serine peptidase [Paracraurococcus lichenis]|uniref:Prolyl oligopeptidase family serine peptidase n=1 Tax=Paracraurococcus lichenis TaxID=3064888 RepID=A0ABT9ECL1_9PROT|nr:prolyl oligopeptidase family serine peptidase [Paracraurococcus sp. LOR1-02]MDO9713849.1 prolyl oligopeptidase family serine peptidase [Paracraurococcus sp. LOR1-02]